MGNCLSTYRAQETDPEHHIKLEDPEMVNRLVKCINFDDIAKSLQTNCVLTEAMIVEIWNHADLEERNRHLLQQMSKRGPRAYERFLDVLQNNEMGEAVRLLKGGIPSHQVLPTGTRLPQVWASGPSGEPVAANPPQNNGHVTTGERSTAEVKVVPATELKSGPKIYPMERKPRGQCLIINNHNFKKLSGRDGSDVDVDHTAKLFTGLHFECKIFQDLTADGMMEELFKVAQEEQQKAADCLVVVLMSHGGMVTIRGSDNEPLPQQCIYGSDDEPVALESICELFNNKNCPSLQGKPKLFFIQACRGGKEDAGVAKYVPPDRTDDTPGPSNLDSYPIQKVTTVSDACICYASVDNYVSYRNGATGSWFLSAIWRVFSQHAHTMHLEEMMHDVHGEVVTAL
ncbi:caspase-3-like [Haemaphysalis longicornis]